MARPLIVAEDLHKALGGKTLLDGASFRLESGERVALVGPNGAGKSTLLEMVAGRSVPDAGHLDIAPHTPIAYATQHQSAKDGARVKDVLNAAAAPPPALAAELAKLEARIADPALYESSEANAVLARYGEVQREIQTAKSVEVDVSPLAEELGFPDASDDRLVSTLSGGERTRLYLSRALASATAGGILILDEPTNHLDLEAIEWLEEWLLAYEGAVVLVAHDRAFLDNVATRVLWLHDGIIESYPGNYEAYEIARNEDEARLALQRERETKELERQKAVIEQFKHQKRFNGQMASRLTRLEKYRSAIDKTPDPLVQRALLSVAFPESFKSSNDVIRVRGLGKKVGEKLLFYDLNFDVLKGDRIGLVGANGVGKTTLLRVLVGKEKKDVGAIEIAPGVRGAYFAQGNESLDVKRTLAEEVLHARPGVAIEDVRALLGKFGFRNEYDPTRKVSSLSGGERSRLALLKTIVTPSNLLILDEPTNHLDIESRVALVGALNAYQGSLLIVSHDRWLLDSVVTKVAVLARRQIKTFLGDFTSSRDQNEMEAFAVEKGAKYRVSKAFKDFDSGTRYTVGSVLEISPVDLAAKRLFRTAIAMGWMAEE